MRLFSNKNILTFPKSRLTDIFVCVFSVFSRLSRYAGYLSHLPITPYNPPPPLNTLSSPPPTPSPHHTPPYHAPSLPPRFTQSHANPIPHDGGQCRQRRPHSELLLSLFVVRRDRGASGSVQDTLPRRFSRRPEVLPFLPQVSDIAVAGVYRIQ